MLKMVVVVNQVLPTGQPFPAVSGTEESVGPFTLTCLSQSLRILRDPYNTHRFSFIS